MRIAPAFGTRPLAVLLLTTLLHQSALSGGPEWSYLVQPGDTLLSLSDTLLEPEHGWRELQRHNRIVDPLRLQPGSTLRVPIEWLRREAAVARVVHIQGDAQLQRDGSAPQALSKEVELRAGDQLRTGAQSSLSLRFVDGSRLLLGPGSQLRLDQLLVHGRSAIPAMQLNLKQGTVENRVHPDAAKPPRYELRSPGLNLGVRGTEFRMQADAGGSRAQVIEGRVAAQSSGAAEQALTAGYGLRAGGTPQRLLPAPALGSLPELLERLPLSLSWPAQPGAIGYRAQLFEAGDTERLVAELRVNEPSARWIDVPDLPDGAYQLRLRGIDAQGLEGLSASAAFVLKARPEPPFLQVPAAEGAVYGEQVRFAWTRSTAALRYRLQLVRVDGDLGQPLVDRSDLSDTELSLTLPPGAYRWRLASIARRADGSADPGPFSELQHFTLRPLPPSPAAEPPEIGERLLLRWRAVPQMSYELQWATDEAFSQGLRSWRGPEPQASFERPVPGRYYLRVRSLDAHGQTGPWGTVQQLDVPYPRWFWLLPLGALLLSL